MGYSNIEKYILFCNKANLFICESTFLETDNVNSKIHLTATQAATIAKKSNVKKLVLMHMWPEYNKVKYLNEAKKIFSNTFVAIENNEY